MHLLSVTIPITNATGVCTEGAIVCGSALGADYVADHQYKCISDAWADQGASETCATAAFPLETAVILIVAVGLVVSGLLLVRR